jgi:type II secretory pathway component PulK
MKMRRNFRRARAGVAILIALAIVAVLAVGAITLAIHGAASITRPPTTIVIPLPKS